MRWRGKRKSSNIDDRRNMRASGIGGLGGLGLPQGSTTSMSSEPLRETAEEKERVDFVSVVLGDTEETWNALFREKGKTYKQPRLVLFRGWVKSAGGMADAAMGPF